jgi:hypothetical protein
MMGCQPGAVKPSYQAPADRVHPDDLAEAAAMLQRSFDEVDEFTSEVRVVWPGGSMRWVGAHGPTDSDAVGRHTRSYGVMPDVSEGRRRQRP